MDYWYKEDIEKARQIISKESVEWIGNTKRETKQLLKTFDLVLAGKFHLANYGYFFQIFDILGVYRDTDNDTMNMLYDFFCTLNGLIKGYLIHSREKSK